jgi:hypothetical protein
VLTGFQRTVRIPEVCILSGCLKTQLISVIYKIKQSSTPNGAGWLQTKIWRLLSYTPFYFILILNSIFHLGENQYHPQRISSHWPLTESKSVHIQEAAMFSIITWLISSSISRMDFIMFIIQYFFLNYQSNRNL